MNTIKSGQDLSNLLTSSTLLPIKKNRKLKQAIKHYTENNTNTDRSTPIII